MQHVLLFGIIAFATTRDVDQRQEDAVQKDI